MDYRRIRLFSHCHYYEFCTECQEVGYRVRGHGPFKHNGDQNWQNQIVPKQKFRVGVPVLGLIWTSFDLSSRPLNL